MCAESGRSGLFKAPNIPIGDCEAGEDYDDDEVEYMSYESRDAGGYCVRSDVNVYPHDLPAQTAQARLEMYLTWLAKFRPSGLVEATLVSYQWCNWHDTLTELGFKVVTEVYNSNSRNIIRVYHLTYGQPEAAKPEAAPTRVANPFGR